MNFRLFGVDVEIEPGFWFMSVIFGLHYFDISRGATGLFPGLIWVLVVLVSVLVHEYGHAFAIRRHRIEPEITLYMMGGKTTWRALLPIKRGDLVLISLAGPFAGFFLAAIVYALDHFILARAASLPELVHFAVRQLVFVNVFWGIFNLVPVLPLDGGHVLEHALGPKRIRITAAISMIVGVGVALFFLRAGSIWAAFIFGMGAFQSLRLLQSSAADIEASDLRPRTPIAAAEPPISAEILSLLSRARQAVADEDIAKARTLCNDIIAREADADNAPPPNARREALEILAWASLLAEEVGDASSNVEEAKKLGDVDLALVGAVHFAKREISQARRVLEAARARGDDRKEVVGPLIQILIEQGEVARAAAIAYDIVDSLSEDDARKMAKLAFDGAAFDWSARLYETVFERQTQPEDAYEAARAHAQDGAYERAIDMLRKAVGAGFNDRARAWSDKALEALRARDGLDGVLPRP